MPKNVLVIGSDYLLNAAILSLLLEQDSLEIYPLNTSDLDKAAENDVFDYPDTIVIDESTMARESESIMSFLDRYAQCRTIVINLNDNKVEIRDKRKYEVRRFDDFLSVLLLE